MDNNLQNSKADETAQNDLMNVEKLKQSYLLLKQKICSSHDLITQYNDKLKECERLKADLDAMTKESKLMTCKYNSTLSKLIKLQLQDAEQKKNIGILTTKINEHEVKVAADQQHIQQLICKIKDLEGQQSDKIMQYDIEKSSLQVKVKELEQELKSTIKSCDTKIKKMEKKTIVGNDCCKPVKQLQVTKLTLDKAVNTSFTVNMSMPQTETTEKCVMTDEHYDVNNHVYPVFCDKCEILLDPPPLDKICKIMRDSCPQLIEKIVSPKKIPTPLRVSADIVDEQCKNESLTRLSETPSPHVQDHSNHTSYIPANILPTHPLAVLNRPNYCSNLTPVAPQIPNLLHQNNYYIDSAPVNHPPLPNSSTTNPDNHYMNVAALPIITSLQERIDTLEIKVKKKLNKRNSMENHHNCWQHKRPPCCTCDVNGSFQSNMTIELWKRMAELYNRKDNRNFRRHGNVNKKPSKLKLREKIVEKRRSLQNSVSSSWNVETIPKRFQHGHLRKRSKKYKHPHSMYLDKTDVALNNTQNLEKAACDSDINSSDDLCNDTIIDSADVMRCSENDEKYKMVKTCYSTTNNNAKTKMFTQPGELVQSSEIGNEETVNCYDLGKSIGETDSGILSDSTEHRRTRELGSSTENLAACAEFDKPIKTDLFGKKPTRSEVGVNQVLNLADDYIKSVKDDTVANSIRLKNSNKRKKVRELKEQKKGDNRQQILKKLRNLKRNRKPVNTCYNGSLHISQNQKRLNNSEESINPDDYIPTKKLRIAHTSKCTANKQSNSSGDNVTRKNNTESSIVDTESNVNLNVREQSNMESVIGSQEEKSKTLSKSNDECKSMESEDVISRSHNVVENIIPEVVHDTNTLLRNDLQSSIVINGDNPQMNGFINSDTTLMQNTILKDISSVNSHNGKNVHYSLMTSDTVIFKGNSQTCNGHIENIVQNEEVCVSIDSVRKPEVTVDIREGDENETKDVIKERIIDTEAIGDDVNIACESVSDSPASWIQKCIDKSDNATPKYKNVSSKLRNVRLMTDKFVERQLQKLVHSSWETSVHWDVVEALKITCSPLIIAKCIIEFLSKEEQCTESLDSSHTPPAPLMTKAQQRVITLVVDLEESKPMLYQLLQAGIEYSLFKLNQSTKRTVLESLTRMYISLARIKKDREKVRIFCCDALYCLGLNVIPILYIVFTSWPEIFPNCETNRDLLPKCIAHIIGMHKATGNFPKLNALKNLISKYYQYPLGTVTKDVLNELLVALENESHNGVHTAIILLAKKEGTVWTYKHIVRDALLPMIINKKHPSMYRAFCLLGDLMRAFPLEDKDNFVGEIAEQLCDLIKSGEGPAEQQEGVISALLSLSRHKFDEILRPLMAWTPIESVHPRTIQQFDGLFKMRQPAFWKSYLKKHYKHTQKVKSAR